MSLSKKKSLGVEFLTLEAKGGIIMIFAALLALIVANSFLYPYYQYFFNEINFRVGFFSENVRYGVQIDKSLLLWINDGFMALFFFFVGLEVKREIMEDELSSRDRLLLPIAGALGGMALPALIYYFINIDHPENLRGWAIPAATDIAFALGILALVGSRVPTSLKVLLTAIAIIDDLGAILIIAAFYTSKISFEFLALGGFAALGLLALNLRNVSNISPYIVLGLILWFAVLKSGVHATLAGVITAFCIPMAAKDGSGFSPCKHLEHSLHPWVIFLILPVFGFANAGLSFSGVKLEALMDSIPLGIAAGLFIGKQIGVFLPLWLLIVLGFSPKPSKANWVQIYGMCVFAGVGFTLSLFIGGLAFEDYDTQNAVKLGVLVGSFLSAILGYALLRYGPSEIGKNSRNL